MWHKLIIKAVWSVACLRNGKQKIKKGVCAEGPGTRVLSTRLTQTTNTRGLPRDGPPPPPPPLCEFNTSDNIANALRVRKTARLR